MSGRERDGCRFFKAQALGLTPHNPLVHCDKFRVAALAGRIARKVDRIADLEAGRLFPQILDHPRRIPSYDLRGIEHTPIAETPLGVDRIHADGPYADEEVAWPDRRQRHRVQVQDLGTAIFGLDDRFHMIDTSGANPKVRNLPYAPPS